MVSYLRRLEAESIHIMREVVGETVSMRQARFCTLGCWPLTGTIESSADSVPAVIDEIRALTASERAGWLIDRDQSGSMERKKREGCF